MSRYDPQKMGIEPCVCGRLSTKVHCPKCGSYEVRARALKTKRILTNGEIEDVQVYRCRVCGIIFDDWDWQFENCYAIKFVPKSVRTFEGFLGKFKESNTPKQTKQEREMQDLEIGAERLKIKHKVKPKPEASSTSSIIEQIEDEDQETKRLKAEIASLDASKAQNIPPVPPVPNWDEMIKKGATIEQIESVKKMRITKGWPV